MYQKYTIFLARYEERLCCHKTSEKIKLRVSGYPSGMKSRNGEVTVLSVMCNIAPCSLLALMVFFTILHITDPSYQSFIRGRGNIFVLLIFYDRISVRCRLEFNFGGERFCVPFHLQHIQHSIQHRFYYFSPRHYINPM